MRSDKSQMMSPMTTRQKIMVLSLIVIIAVIIWQAIGLFGKKEIVTAPAKNMPMSTVKSVSDEVNAPMSTTPQSMTVPKKVEIPLSPREIALIKLQQETQAKYVEAINELQMLKVSREIAETNQAIVTAKLATITAQKNIVELLTPPAPPPTNTYAQGLVSPTAVGSSGGRSMIAEAEVKYTVISVSQLQYRWNAVLGYQGNLYNVTIGDVLPPDGSKVIKIDKSGVLLEKEGNVKKISLVPII